MTFSLSFDCRSNHFCDIKQNVSPIFFTHTLISTHPLVVVEVDVVVVVEIVVVLSEMVEDGKELLKTFAVVRGAAVVLLALNFPWTLANKESFILTLVLL